MKGVPIRIAIGARDLENNVVELARGIRKRQPFRWTRLTERVTRCFSKIQQNIYNKALQYRDSHITARGYLGSVCGNTDHQNRVCVCPTGMVLLKPRDKIKEMTKATIRCIPTG